MSLYEITILNDSATGNVIRSFRIDGVLNDGYQIELVDDGDVNHVEIQLSKNKLGET